MQVHLHFRHKKCGMEQFEDGLLAENSKQRIVGQVEKHFVSSEEKYNFSKFHLTGELTNGRGCFSTTGLLRTFQASDMECLKVTSISVCY